LAALLQGIRAAAVSQTLWRGTGNGITELLQTVPPIFGWAASTLGIGPHSSYVYIAPCELTSESVFECFVSLVTYADYRNSAHFISHRLARQPLADFPVGRI